MGSSVISMCSRRSPASSTKATWTRWAHRAESLVPGAARASSSAPIDSRSSARCRRSSSRKARSDRHEFASIDPPVPASSRLISVAQSRYRAPLQIRHGASHAVVKRRPWSKHRNHLQGNSDAEARHLPVTRPHRPLCVATRSRALTRSRTRVVWLIMPLLWRRKQVCSEPERRHASADATSPTLRHASPAR